MKSFIKYFLLVAGIFLICAGCEEKEFADYTAPDTLSDVSWLIGTQPFSSNPNDINAETPLAFLDLSQGAISHEWIIEEGNKFLTPDYEQTDSIYDKFIRDDVDLSLSEPKAFILFRNSGDNKVRLLNKFDEKVTYKSSVGNLEAVQDNEGFWVIDTTFNFNVYAKILPAFSVLKDGVEILNVTEDDETSLDDESTWPVVEIEASTALTFKDNTTTGRPNATNWINPNGVPSQSGGEESVVKFFKLGTFNAGTLRSRRIAPLPTFSVDKVIPLKVKVIQSSQPFEFDGALTEDENQVISFRVTGEVEAFSDEEDNFTVHVTNATSGFDKVIPVASATVNEDNSIFIKLTLTEPIYNSDVVTVSYNGTGNIQSSDERVLGAFGPEEVKMHFGGNLIPEKNHASFEDPSGNFRTGFALNYWIGPSNDLGGGNYIYERVLNRATDGEASMKFSSPASNPFPNGNLFSFGIARISPLPAGTYRIVYDLYIEPGTTLKAFRTEFNQPAFSRQIWDIENEARGEWVTVANTFTTDEIPSDSNMRYTFRVAADDNPGVSGAQEMYLDNLRFIEIEQRP